MNQTATAPVSEQPAVQPAPKKQMETYWHVVVFFGDKFADYQIAMTYPFFHIGDVRAAIEKEVQKPVVIMNWSKLGLEEYASSRGVAKAPQAAAPQPVAALAPVPTEKPAKQKLHKAKKK